MCGICGIVAREPVDERVLRAMATSLASRGPDDEGYYLGQNAGLGHRRLSIIDMSGGRQPIANEDQTLWIILNGEIYNYRALRDELEKQGHRFRTDTDTETILHLFEEHGTDCVRRLRGMFAFAIWDTKKSGCSPRGIISGRSPFSMPMRTVDSCSVRRSRRCWRLILHWPNGPSGARPIPHATDHCTAADDVSGNSQVATGTLVDI